MHCDSVIPIQNILDHFSDKLDPLDFIEKLNITSDNGMNTAAHFAVYGGKLRNFEVLMQHETDIWKPNFRGIRAYDVYSRLLKIGYDFRKIEVMSVSAVRDKLKKYYLNNILFGCKMQSLINKELSGERGQLIDLIEKNAYEIAEDLRELKQDIENRYNGYFDTAQRQLSGITNFLKKVEDESLVK